MANSIRERLVLVFDTETTGVNVEEDRVVQLGAAYYQNGRRVGRPRAMLVNPGMPIPEGASNVHGFTDDHVADAPDWAQVGSRFAEHLEQGPTGEGPPVLCGYNAISYDVPLINAEYARHQMTPRIDPARVLDPILFVRWAHRAWPKRSLEHVAARKGIQLLKAHTADADAMATGEVLLRMLDEGLIPDDLDEALARQQEIAQRIDSEWGRFKHSLYCHRESGELMVGFGKHIGTPLVQVDPGYLEFCLRKFDGLTEETRECFQAAVEGRLQTGRA